MKKTRRKVQPNFTLVLAALTAVSPLTPQLLAPAFAQSPSTLAAPSAVPVALPDATAAKLRGLLSAPSLEDARIGVSIVALGTVETPASFPSRHYADKKQPQIFTQDDAKRFMPASNMKLYTAALALKVLGPNKTLVTTVVAEGNGVRLWLVGGGDPSFDRVALRNLAFQVAAKGIKEVSEVVVDNSLFRAENIGARYPDGWTLDDALWYYGPEVSAFAYERNQADLVITGGAKSGDAATVKLEPEIDGFRIGNELQARITTGSAALINANEDDLIRIDRALASDDNRISVTGAVAPNQKLTIGIAVPNPAQWARSAFVHELRALGIRVGESVATPQNQAQNPAAARVVASHDSPPVGVLLRRFLKNSDNLYGEMLLRLCGLDSTNPQ
ncbi:MAG TPA: D-alanyl-D-alanine carboxypeptidase/D-alanyl-D-alanine-endopeptidase, partial [Abditibacteriaceae bacterium]